MTLQPQHECSIPEETRRVAHAAYPKGNMYMKMRDALGTIYQDQAFAHLFPHNGRPVEAPWRLALITVMQFIEERAFSTGCRRRSRSHRLEILAGTGINRSWL
jgi:transposase